MPYARILTYTDRAYRREKVVAAYKQGAKPLELVERFGLSNQRVYAILIAEGMRRHTPRTRATSSSREGAASLTNAPLEFR